MSIFSYFRNKALLRSLIEECQTYGNRMEAGLNDQLDIQVLHKKKSKLEAEVRVLAKSAGKCPDAESKCYFPARQLDSEL